ncbi:MAG TPA: hypothetical protein VFZ66_27645 [Herpetosiphonaceae bacterium]
MTQAGTRSSNHPAPPTGDAATGATSHPPLWPIRIARDIYKYVDGHVGMTLTIWATSTIGLVLSFVLFRSYIWPLWRRSWLTIWPSDLPESVIALPLLALLLGSLLNRVWHGRIWAGVILTTYVVLHANLYVPTPATEPATHRATAQAAAAPHDTPAALVPTTLHIRQLGPLIVKQPEIVVLGIVTAIAPVMAVWLFGVLSLSFLWPSIVAVITIGNTYVDARAAQRRLNVQRRLQEEAWQHQVAHEQQMNKLRLEAWRDEEQHVALENSIARQHQRRELQNYQQHILAAGPDTADHPAPGQSTDELLAQLVNEQ